MILLENHEIYKMIINANWVQYENSLKIYELGNISLPRGSFASTPISILGLLKIL